MWGMVQAMDETRLTCPKCGGHAARDLRSIRRWTGVVLTTGSLVAVGLLANSETVIPSWSLPVVTVVFLLGATMWIGARRAVYCEECDVRME